MVEGGTVVVIEGPRFSTRAESRWYADSGFDVINMTQYPECWLARELELCYANISLVTDYDVGLKDRPDVAPVSADMAFGAFADNLDRLRALLFRAVPKIGATAGRHLRDGVGQRNRPPLASALTLLNQDGGHTPWNS